MNAFEAAALAQQQADLFSTDEAKASAVAEIGEAIPDSVYSAVFLRANDGLYNATVLFSLFDIPGYHFLDAAQVQSAIDTATNTLVNVDGYVATLTRETDRVRIVVSW